MPLLERVELIMSDEREAKLSLKDYIAFLIALLTTHLLPLILVIIITILLVILIGYLF